MKKNLISVFLLCFFVTTSGLILADDLWGDKCGDVNSLSRPGDPALVNDGPRGIFSATAGDLLNRRVCSLKDRMTAFENVINFYDSESKRLVSQKCDEYKDELLGTYEKINNLEERLAKLEKALSLGKRD